MTEPIAYFFATGLLVSKFDRSLKLVEKLLDRMFIKLSPMVLDISLLSLIFKVWILLGKISIALNKLLDFIWCTRFKLIVIIFL